MNYYVIKNGKLIATCNDKETALEVVEDWKEKEPESQFVIIKGKEI